jgi:16S rRNA G1207 methylase RsmC
MIEIPDKFIPKHTVKRIQVTSNNSLKAWNAADEFMIWYVNQKVLAANDTLIVNDNLGFLTTHLINDKTTIVCSFKSQEDAIFTNLKSNQINFSANQFLNPLNLTNEFKDLVLIKTPKSIDLLEFYLQIASNSIKNNGIVICGFMTKYFTPQMLKIASKYFSNIEQTKAWKKSRLMILSGTKNATMPSVLKVIESKYGIFKQYNGVFSSNHIDYATQFLIENFEVPKQTQKILDLASGNGVLAKVVKDQLPDSEIHLVDDSILAIESSKLNILKKNVYFHHNYTLKDFEEDFFDYVISNPPFHIEHEIDLSIPIGLFKQVFRVLKTQGIFEMVANRHLKYLPSLEKIFSKVTIKTQNNKFIIYRCEK